MYFIELREFRITQHRLEIEEQGIKRTVELINSLHLVIRGSHINDSNPSACALRLFSTNRWRRNLVQNCRESKEKSKDVKTSLQENTRLAPLEVS